MSLIRFVTVAALLLVGTVGVGAQGPHHPLDALTAAEYWTVYDAIRATGRTDAETRFGGINLREPAKYDVLNWASGEPFSRQALAVVTNGPSVVEAVVDLADKAVVSWEEVEGVYPTLTPEEFGSLSEAIKEDESWRAAMERRGITDFATISCWANVLGYFDLPEEQGRRLARGSCSDRHGAFSGHATRVEGVTVLVDVETREVVRVIDSDVVPITRGSADHDRAAIGPAREVPSPIFTQQPGGPGFTLDGSVVEWQKWRFHFRLDPRMGVVVSDVRYADQGRDRSVLYQGALTEIFVPYQDPTEGWYYVTYLDVGELSFGLATSLQRGIDCPDHAVFVDGVYADHRGMPFRMPSAACLFEREAGDVAWRHYGGRGQIEGRIRRDLVLRMIATIGNYDYLVDWVFRQDGTIQVAGGATGMVNIKAVKEATAAEHGGSNPPDSYGRFVDEHTVAVNHDHFLSFRLDLDVDGPENSFVVDRLVRRPGPKGSPRKSFWQVQPTTLRSEAEARLDVRLDRPSLWRVVNGDAVGRLGYPSSYHIKPGSTAISLLSDDDNPQARAGFAKHTLWVTQYQAAERFAVGDYVVGSQGGGWSPGLDPGRPVTGENKTSWSGTRWVCITWLRAEDWPVMPTTFNSVELRPFDFFDRNPALDLPR